MTPLGGPPHNGTQPIEKKRQTAIIRTIFGQTPQLHPSVFVSEAAYIVGNIQVGQGSSIWPGAVLRADHGRIAIGRRSTLQDRVVVHSGGGVENEGQVEIGEGTVIGHSAVVHCRKIGSHVLIGNNATILDGAIIGDRSIVAPGTVVLPRTHTPPGSYLAGLPAQVLRPLTAEEEAMIERVAQEASALASLYRDGALDSNPEEKNMIRSFQGKSPKVHPRAYVNEAAYLVGDVELGELTSLWPGATVRGDVAKVTVGKNTSLQDNVVVHAHEALTIGDNNTVGHAVVIHARRIGSNNLLGMNCTLEEGVEVGDNCVIAAGAVVPAGMVVPSESFVAGNPAQVLWRVESNRRESMQRIRGQTGWSYGELGLEYAREGRGAAVAAPKHSPKR